MDAARRSGWHSGWDGGWGTFSRSDPQDTITMLMTQVAWTSPTPNICLDFWTTAYQAVDD